MYTILVIEDNDADVMMLEDMIERTGLACSIRQIRDGFDVTQYLARAPEIGDPPRLILLDVNVPRLSGFEVLAHIRQTQWLDNTPVVMWSSSRSPQEQAKAAALGVIEFCEKPGALADWQQLIARLGPLIDNPAA